MRPFIIFPADTTDFSDTSLAEKRILTPTDAEYTIELKGAGSIHIEHPVDDLGKWREIALGKIILAPIYRRGVEFPQPFRIYRITKSRKNGVPTISADALHVFYDLNFTIFHPDTNYIENSVTLSTWLSGLGIATLQPFTWYHHADEEYWNPTVDLFTFTTNIDTTINIVVNGGTLVEHLVGGADSLVSKANAFILCDGFNVHIDNPSTHTKLQAFNIAYGLNLNGITQTVDDSNVITCLYPSSNLDDMEGTVYPPGYDYPCEKYAEMGYPFSRVASVDFNYQVDEDQNISALWNKFLRTDAPGYFTKRSRPKVKYSVDLNARQIAEEVKNIATFEVGDSGFIRDPDLGIESYQTITKKVVDLMTQRVKSIELSDSKAAPFQAEWGGIVSSGQTSLDRRIKSI